MEPVDLREVTREVVELSRNELERGRVVLRLDVDPRVPRVLGDRIQLQQVILNLLLNAADAMSEVHDRPREIQIRIGRDAGDHVRMDVKDAGLGVAPGKMDRLFEAFYTTKKHGMGIGLSVSRSIIEGHRGQIWSSANSGSGATFSFSLPSAD
jgi:signal transduction histidine kinase